MKTARLPIVEELEARITPSGLPTLNISNLGGHAGFQVSSPVAMSGFSGVGDFNGDGVDDFVISAATANSNKGEIFLVYGKSGGFPATFDLTTLNGTNGFVINGEATGDKFGTAVGFGDVNADGLKDLIVGAPGVDAGGSDRGAAYVIFGRTSNVGASLALSSLNGTTGFKVTGAVNGSQIGEIIGSSGDIDGDGDDELTIGAPNADIYKTNAGAGFLIFGKSSGFAAVISTSALDGTNGFTLVGGNANARFGQAIGLIGDVNLDGYADISIGGATVSSSSISNTSVGHILFGGPTSYPALINVDSIAQGKGFVMGPKWGSYFLGNGGYMYDISGDGIPDFVTAGGVEASFNTAYAGIIGVIGSQTNGILTDPFAKSGAKVVGRLITAGTGFQAVMGDFNGDGIGDTSFSSVNDTVASLYFGKKTTSLSLIGPKDAGIAFTGLATTNFLNPSIDFLGDINGDGFEDLMLKSQNGTTGYMVFGTGMLLSADGKTATFKDTDGDVVTVKTTAGAFDYSQFEFSQPVNAVAGGKHLDNLNLNLGGTAFADASITVTVKKAAGGDGKVDIGKIDATGIDLGAVKIPGRLGQIIAGDGIATDIGLKGLDVLSFGRAPGGTAVGASVIKGSVGNITVKGNFTDATLQITGAATAGAGAISVDGDFSGTLDIAGSLASFKSRDFLPNSVLKAATAGSKAATLTFHQVGDSTTIDIAGAINKLSAARIGESTILADRIATLAVSGNAKAGITGDFLGSLTLDNGDGSYLKPVLNSASFTGLVQSAQFKVNGSVGTFTAAAMETSTLYAGYQPASAGAPLNGGTFLAGASLKTFKITGKTTAPGAAGSAFDSSFVVAPALGTITVSSLDSTNGNLTWGFGYQQSLKSLKVTTPTLVYSPANPSVTLDDFRISKIA